MRLKSMLEYSVLKPPSPPPKKKKKKKKNSEHK